MLPDPVPQLKEQLRREILELVADKPLGVGANVIGLDLPRMSHLGKGHLDRFSLEKLIRILAFVDREATVVVIDKSTMSPWRMLCERYKRERNERERNERERNASNN